MSELKPYTNDELAAVEEEYAVISDPENYKWTRTRRMLFLSGCVPRLLATARAGLEDKERMDWLEENLDCAEDETWREWVDARRKASTTRSGRGASDG
jgi:hypothetical protein